MSRSWVDIKTRASINYTCGFCGHYVSSEKGWCTGDHRPWEIRICPNCLRPTLFDDFSKQFPEAKLGAAISMLPESISALYEEARACTKGGCYTAAVMLCRKLLMNVAVEEGAKEGLQFGEYVDFLAKQGIVPPKAKSRLDLVRIMGNEANHEIKPKNKDDAKQMLDFLMMILKINYEFSV